MADADATIAEFVAADKIAKRKLRWYSKTHPDFYAASLSLHVPGKPALLGHLELAAHKSRVPRKYSYSIIFRDTRVLGLDVNPASTHFNTDTLKIVKGTHWHEWPSTSVIPDERELNHRGWLDEFLKKGHIHYPFPYKPPPEDGVQPELGL